MSAPLSAAFLPPGLEPRVEQVFGQLGPDVSLKSARISASRVDAVVCSGEGGCARLVLSAPTPCADGTPAGPFCAHWPDGAPAYAARVHAAWAGQPAAAYWQAQTDPAPTHGRWTAAPPSEATLDGGVALTATVLPLLAGAVVMLGAKRVVARSPLRVWWTLVAVLVGGTAAYELGSQPVALWDAVWSAALASFGALLVAAGRARAALIGAVLAVALAALELGLRQLPEAPRPAHPHWFTMMPWARLDPEGSDSLGRNAHWRTYACTTMGTGSAGPRSQTAGDSRPTTLHLGDSLVHGISVPPDEALVGQLDRQDPTMHHVHRAMPGTSVDAALVALRNWGPLLRPQRVVLHIYSGNDLWEVGAEYPCCVDKPLLDWSSPALASMCAQPAAPLLDHPRLANLVWNSPPPYSWRWLAQDSALASQLGRGLVALAHGHSDLTFSQRGERATALQAQRYRTALDALAAEARQLGAQLLLTLAPDAEVMRGSDEHRASMAAMRALLTEAGYDVWDGHAVLAKAWHQLGPEALLLNAAPRDMHLNAEGHRLWASELLPWLQARPSRP